MELNFFLSFQTHEDPNREKLMKMTKEDLITLTKKILGSDVFNFICKSVSNDVLPGGIGEVES